jgi:hypothetical protein
VSVVTEDQEQILEATLEPEGGQALLPPGHQTTANNVLAIIERIAKDPDFDTNKMEALLAMQERILAKNAEISFNQSMARLQPKLPVIKQRGKIKIHGLVQSRYALYEDIDEAIRPLLADEGFSVRYTTKQANKDFTVFATLSHRDGHSITSELALPIDTSGNKWPTQGVGSTVSYAKRYLITMMLNLVTADDGSDDGGQAAGRALIEAPQVDEIERKIREVGADRAGFLKFLGVTDVPEIKMGDFTKAMNALNLKAQQQVKSS